MLIFAGQGILLSLGLISSVGIKKWSNFFLGLITLLISLQILDVWGIRTGYHNLEGRFPFWNFYSYLYLPPALFFFGKINTVPRFQLKKLHTLFFVPAILEIAISSYVDYSNQYLGTQIQLLQNSLYAWTTQLIPVIGMTVVVVLFGKDIYSLDRQFKKTFPSQSFEHLFKIKVLFLFFFLLTVLWILEAILRNQIILACK